MNIKIYKNQIKKEVVKSLIEYMRECGKESGYNILHVLQCKHILIRYIKKLHKICNAPDDSIMKVVEWAVVALNQLNEKTEYCLIETDARESIWEIIQNAAVDCGLRNYEEDITEEWREW